ncbi:hypothetical protein J31TS4_34380 [Paenibacillus sp. J31TS4]|uniref:hypothetical protein n=1 Tax=Paenibacillus sp. J31TS4 TaxID=2807195 RepID=UPI001B2B894F|nr:hypothetical protein [Paenibacillus sp. J31TS4]GIP40158.1 hypothetical protein J31TS4_34380 [Paenibacillus sp. J31TS4]
MQNQMQQQQQQPLMQVPPQVVTDKDCLYLKDELSWELLAMKKCHAYAQQCSDPDIAQAINRAGQMHQRHYNMLLKHLQNNNTQMMQNVPQLQQQQQQMQMQMQQQQQQQMQQQPQH